jgi:His/Glu/Gln/Arg/opine family amino acid ABC transporter permease subunit
MTLFSGYGLQLLNGAAVSIFVTIGSIFFGTIIGVIIGAIKVYSKRPFSYIAEIYTAVVRGVPDLIVIYLVYFGSTIALTKLAGRYVDVDGFSAGIFALAFIFGAYAGDIFRGAIRQVPAGQVEAAHSLGLPRRVTFVKVILPQAWRLALPGYGNLSIILLKQTSLISVIGLEELLRASTVVSGSTHEPFYVYSAAAVIYLVLTGVVSAGLRAARNRSNRGSA